MAKRIKPQLETEEPKNNYFVSSKPHLKFVSSGCTLLDCALGGGYVLGRMTNIVGDKSTAKTALATEALINFRQSYPDGKAYYRDVEAAFDQDYAAAMGLPVDDIDFGDPDAPLATSEDFIRDFDKILDAHIKSGEPGIYVIDSIDALSDEDEMDSDVGKGTYGTAKAKQLSRFFRTNVHRMAKTNMLLLIVSQVRENIGAGLFGEKYKRSGGKSLDFYASQVMWLAKIKTLERTINKVKRAYGVTIKAQLKKNKIALPFREAEFDFLFGYGVDDIGASLDWLDKIGRLKEAGIGNIDTYLATLDMFTPEEYRAEQRRVGEIVKKVWAEVETTFLPRRSKYG